MSAKELFWSRVQKSEGCWEYVGPRDRAGYGGIYDPERKHNVGAHRFSWELHNGPIPDGLWVLHSCDNPPCVRPGPRHLRLGTRADNTADMMERCRARSSDGSLLIDPTRRQVEVLRFIDGHVRQRGFPPTVRDIGAAFEISSTNGVNDHLKGLLRRGLLVKTPGIARSLVVTVEGAAVLRGAQ